jgi:foldase protein PrsA
MKRSKVMKTFLSKNLIWLVIIAAIISIAAIYIALTGSDDNAIVATVGSEKITKDEFYDALVKYYGADTLENMITDKIIEAETKKADINITDAEIQSEMDRIIEAYGGQETFNQQMALSGTTPEALEADIASYLKTLKLLEPRIAVTEEEISTYFEENRDYFVQPEQVEASHILVENETAANKVKALLKDGKDFAELAAEFSMDSSNAQNGGELGYFGRGEMVEAFEAAAFSLKINEISDPVKTEFGYHIIKVTDRQEALETSLEANRPEIEETLKNEKLNSEYSAWLTEKQEEYDIFNSLVQ